MTITARVRGEFEHQPRGTGSLTDPVRIDPALTGPIDLAVALKVEESVGDSPGANNRDINSDHVSLKSFRGCGSLATSFVAQPESDSDLSRLERDLQSEELIGISEQLIPAYATAPDIVHNTCQGTLAFRCSGFSESGNWITIARSIAGLAVFNDCATSFGWAVVEPATSSELTLHRWPLGDPSPLPLTHSA